MLFKQLPQRSKVNLLIPLMQPLSITLAHSLPSCPVALQAIRSCSTSDTTRSQLSRFKSSASSQWFRFTLERLLFRSFTPNGRFSATLCVTSTKPMCFTSSCSCSSSSLEEKTLSSSTLSSRDESSNHGHWISSDPYRPTSKFPSLIS